MIIAQTKFKTNDSAHTHYCEALDEAIDAIRDNYYVKGFFIMEEYRLTVEQAIEFEKRHYTGTVPPMIVSYSQSMEVMPETATQYILATKKQLEHMLEVTCHARLLGRASILAAQNPAQMRAAYDAALATLPELPTPQPL